MYGRAKLGAWLREYGQARANDGWSQSEFVVQASAAVDMLLALGREDLADELVGVLARAVRVIEPELGRLLFGGGR